VDDPYGAHLATSTTLSVMPVSRGDAKDISSTLAGTIFFWRGHLVNTPLIGDYNIDNSLMAMTILTQLGADEGRIAAAMAGVAAVPGRFEVVHRGDVTVFGCGGDRDRAKRPEMGKVASELSDVTIVTSDNPRHEAPDAIIDAIIAGAVVSADVEREIDRRAAIARALQRARAGDVVVVAGKGHETTQTFADRVEAFDDREVVAELVKGMSC